MENKWIRAAIPALMIHCSIGTVYCWSTFKEAVSQQIGMSTLATGWAFSLAIFFLGMSAAFAGRVVELDIKQSSLVSAVCFSLGMICTGITILYAKGITALIGVYFFYGCVMGVGLGVGYLTPVKNLMIWFPKQKGLATGISIMGFGLAKAIATPIMEYLQVSIGIAEMFILLGSVYGVIMLIAHRLIKKPDGWVESSKFENTFTLKKLLSDKLFVYIWLMFYINIHCGLMLISYEKQILESFYGHLTLLVAIVPSITALSNALGRLGYSTISDKFKNRLTVYGIIFTSCMCLGFLSLFIIKSSELLWIIVLFLIVVNLGYGGGFSTLPALLSQYYGMDNISKIHGIALTAWAVAGLTGNNTSALLLHFSDGKFFVVFACATLLYWAAFVVIDKLKRDTK